jgi:hypothetical protein
MRLFYIRISAAVNCLLPELIEYCISVIGGMGGFEVDLSVCPQTDDLSMLHHAIMHSGYLYRRSPFGPRHRLALRYQHRGYRWFESKV